MTTPRYPTSAKYRRHRSKSYIVPATIGLLFGGGVFLFVQLFTGDDADVKKSAETQISAKIDIPEDVMPISEGDASTSQMVSLKIPVKFKPRDEPKPEIKKPLLKTAKKQQDIVEKIIIESTSEVIEEEKKDAAKQDEELVPAKNDVVPLPSALQPKHRDPDVEITFYREFSKRKVVVPKEELIPQTEDVSGLIETSNINIPRPNPQLQKVGMLGVYQVQLVIFSSLERASAVVTELRNQKAPAYLVKVKGEKEDFYRVRLGPFSSQLEAKWAMDRWKIRGSSPLILRQRP
ncbi:MAG: SPOR domain-containing protein [Magnetococcales bacterium]|nr:SPOR domain-containing protein [Magnetococcales bacterium]